MRLAPLILAFTLVSCGEPISLGNSAEGPADAIDNKASPELSLSVRIGEFGPNFKACGSVGTPRHLGEEGKLAVRRAPFDEAEESGSVPAGARFFVCARSLDQEWFGIVFDDSGTLARSCGVDSPVTRKQDYSGPCRSGWVESAFVKLISGIDPPPLSRAPAGAISATPGG